MGEASGIDLRSSCHHDRSLDSVCGPRLVACLVERYEVDRENMCSDAVMVAQPLVVVGRVALGMGGTLA